LKLKPLYEGQNFVVVCVHDGETYPVEDFLSSTNKSIQAYLSGLRDMIAYAAENGLENCPTKWLHEANKDEKIYEFIKGPFRVFFFKGDGDTIAVCTGFTRKSGDKADGGCVGYAAIKRREYFEAVKNGTIEFENEG